MFQNGSFPWVIGLRPALTSPWMIWAAGGWIRSSPSRDSVSSWPFLVVSCLSQAVSHSVPKGGTSLRAASSQPSARGQAASDESPMV